jgi:hypothetical protein
MEGGGHPKKELTEKKEKESDSPSLEMPRHCGHMKRGWGGCKMGVRDMRKWVDERCKMARRERGARVNVLALKTEKRT